MGLQTITSPAFNIDLAMLIRFGTTKTYNDVKSKLDIQVYPNPTKQFIYISGNYTIPAVLNVYDITGRKILNERITSKNQKINIERYSKGMYFYKLMIADHPHESGKIIIE